MTWLATQAKNSKLANDKAMQELQAYTQILRGMEKRLQETEMEKHVIENNLIEELNRARKVPRK